MLVKIREDGQRHLAYFLDSRRMIGVNSVGATILNSLFNEGRMVSEIAEIVASEYNIGEDEALSDVASFLSEVRTELQPEKFNSLEQEQVEIPIGVELEITTDCNLRCRHCLQENYVHEFMAMERASEILNILSAAGVFEVSVIGGEPFRHPHIQEILRYCAEHEFATNVVTNGTLVSGEVAEWLAPMEQISVFVSLDGPEPEHDYIRGQGTFRKATEAIRRLATQSTPVEVIYTINARNASAYLEVLELCADLKVPCNFNLFKPFKDSHTSLVLKPEEFFAIVRDLFRLREAGTYRIGISNAAIVGELLGQPHNECRASQSGFVITTHGRMLTCPSLMASGYYCEDQLPYFDENFVQTWHNHEVFTRFRANGLSGCQAHSFIFEKDVTIPDPYGLQAFRKFLYSQRTS